VRVRTPTAILIGRLVFQIHCVMALTVLLFGPYAASAGAGSVRVKTPENPTSEQVLMLIGQQHPVLVPLLRAARLAVNHSFASAGTVIHPDDEVAVIGLVSGG